MFTHDKDCNAYPTPDGEPAPTMPQIDVTTHGVLKLLMKLYAQKATGPDMLRPMGVIVGKFAPPPHTQQFAYSAVSTERNMGQDVGQPFSESTNA